MKHNKMYFIFSFMIILIFSCDTQNKNDTAKNLIPESRIVGITEGSVYSSFVQSIWYPRESTAVISINGGKPVSISYFEKISNPGIYRLEVTDPFSSAKATVNFQIISDPGKESATYQTNGNKNGKHVEIEFVSGQYHATQGTPIMAIWVEDMSGHLLQNIFVSQFPGANVPRGSNFEKRRPTCLPYWLHKAGKDWNNGNYNTDPNNKIPSDIDAVTGATMKTNFKVVSKIDPHITGSRVKIFFEIDQAYDWGHYFTEQKEIDDSGVASYYAHVGEPSLIYAVEVDLNVPGTVNIGGTDTTVKPVGYSDWTAKTGDFYEYDDKYFDNAYLMTKKITIQIF
jgi:hypothetical protein